MISLVIVEFTEVSSYLTNSWILHPLHMITNLFHILLLNLLSLFKFLDMELILEVVLHPFLLHSHGVPPLLPPGLYVRHLPG